MIALGRALTGDRELEVTAGCCTVSTYKRKTEGGKAATVGEWDIVKNGDASFLEKGVERNWSVSLSFLLVSFAFVSFLRVLLSKLISSTHPPPPLSQFRDVVLSPDGEVIQVRFLLLLLLLPPISTRLPPSSLF